MANQKKLENNEEHVKEPKLVENYKFSGNVDLKMSLPYDVTIENVQNKVFNSITSLDRQVLIHFSSQTNLYLYNFEILSKSLITECF